MAAAESATPGAVSYTHLVGQALHRLDEVAALADDPGAAHDVVARAPGHGDVAGGLGLALSLIHI